VAHALYPALLQRFGLSAALQQLSEVGTHTFGGQVQVVTEYSGGLLPAQELALYRIAQELFNNALRHGRGANRIDVELLHPTVTSLLLRVRDNGCGFDYAARRTHSTSTGVGLSSIEARASLLGTQLRISAVPGNGTCAEVEFSFFPPT
jgi:signal transduction histidine kinase